MKIEILFPWEELNFIAATPMLAYPGTRILMKGKPMQVLRTPDERFEELEGFDFEPRYVDIGELRVHYLDEGPSASAPVLLMHGEPSWCYLYRKMVPILVQAGHRCVVPDLIGFGRSDKLARREDYSYQFHVDVMASFVKAMNLQKATLFGQDWGGLIGLRVLAGDPERFARVVAANTGLPDGSQKPSAAFLKWLDYSQNVEDFHVGNIVNTGCLTQLSAGAVAAYDAPFPDDRYKEGARAFPALVPIRPDDPSVAASQKAWEVLRAWAKPFLTAPSDSDPITRGAERAFQKLVPGAAGQPHTIIEGAGHFLQEDKGEELASLIVDFIARTA